MKPEQDQNKKRHANKKHYINKQSIKISKRINSKDSLPQEELLLQIGSDVFRVIWTSFWFRPNEEHLQDYLYEFN